eukprot:2338475-Rhodomonas_salina.1
MSASTPPDTRTHFPQPALLPLFAMRAPGREQRKGRREGASNGGRACAGECWSRRGGAGSGTGVAERGGAGRGGRRWRRS